MRGGTYKKPCVLDPCCGGKMFWFDKEDSRAVFTDIRRVPKHEYYKHKYIEVAPDYEVDFRNLPFKDETFWHIVFDPPHIEGLSKKSWMCLKYGTLDATWRDMIRAGFNECWRVLKTNGTLIFKWSSVKIPVSEVLKVIPQKPLYGNRSVKSTTHWIAFIKDEESGEQNGE